MRKNLLFLFATVASLGVYAQEVIFEVKAPAELAGVFDMRYAKSNSWTNTPDMTDPGNAVTNQLVLAHTNTPEDTLCCSTISNPNEIAGKIAVIYRGTCEFGVKAKNAEQAGAIAVLIISDDRAIVEMGPGAVGAEVNIPVVLVEKSTGFLLHDAIVAGSVTAYIGVKPSYPVDLGSNRGKAIWPQITSLPLALFDTFSYTPGIWVHNNGTANQSGVTINAKINNGSGDIYNQSQTISLNSGDSVYLSFEVFTPPYGTGAYKSTYTITPSTTDEFALDNIISQDFYITSGLFSYSPIDFNQNKIKPSAYYRFNAPSPAKYCIALQNAHLSRLKAQGMSFAMTADQGFSLKDQYIHFSFYEWNDNFANLDGNVLYENLNSITDADFVFESDLRDTPIFVPFSQEVTLVDNQRYLGCLEFSIDKAFLGSNTMVDMWESTVRYNQPTTPGQDGDGTWGTNGSAFGLDNVLSIGLHTTEVAGGINNTSSTEGRVFPMPAKTLVNIPMAANGAKTADIQVLDITGKEVMKLNGKFENGSNLLQVNTGNLSNGSYVFNVRFDNGNMVNYRVVISH